MIVGDFPITITIFVQEKKSFILLTVSSIFLQKKNDLNSLSTGSLIRFPVSLIHLKFVGSEFACKNNFLGHVINTIYRYRRLL